MNIVEFERAKDIELKLDKARRMLKMARGAKYYSDYVEPETIVDPVNRDAWEIFKKHEVETIQHEITSLETEFEMLGRT